MYKWSLYLISLLYVMWCTNRRTSNINIQHTLIWSHWYVTIIRQVKETFTIKTFKNSASDAQNGNIFIQTVCLWLILEVLAQICLVWARFVWLFISVWGRHMQIIHLNSRDETPAASKQCFGRCLLAEDNCVPEIREQGDCCPEADGRDISLCPSGRDRVFLLFPAKRPQDKCKALCWGVYFPATPCQSLACIFHQTHWKCWKFNQVKSWLVSAVWDVWGQRSEHQQNIQHISQRRWTNAERS